MKECHSAIWIIVLLAGLWGCRKDNDLKPDNPLLISDSITADHTLTSSAVAPLTVQTIAGMPFMPGYADGTGLSARFYDPHGIQLMDDGTLYVADYMNDRIRKISPPNIVTTLELPKNHLGKSISRPWGIGITTDGTINVTGRNENDYMRAWIFRPGVTAIVTGRIPTIAYNSVVNTLSPDLAGNFWYTDYVGLRRCTVNSEEKLSTVTIVLHRNQLAEPERSQAEIAWTFRFAHNGVIYLCPQYLDALKQLWVGDHLYKYTPAGGLKRVYETLQFRFITSILSTKDSKTLYVADFGNIYRIYNGKATFLVGNTGQFGDGRDGVGRGADVNAFHMALSKDENTIYFTDRSHRVRKLMLK